MKGFGGGAMIAAPLQEALLKFYAKVNSTKSIDYSTFIMALVETRHFYFAYFVLIGTRVHGLVREFACHGLQNIVVYHEI